MRRWIFHITSLLSAVLSTRSMEAMRRWIWNLACLLSALLFVAVVVLWVHSVNYYDSATFQVADKVYDFATLQEVDSQEGWNIYLSITSRNGIVAFRMKRDNRLKESWRFKSWRFKHTLIPHVQRGLRWWALQPYSVTGPRIEVKSFRMSHWIVALILAILPTIWFIRFRRRIRPGHCKKCGYDLRGSIGSCPECGTLIKAPREAPTG